MNTRLSLLVLLLLPLLARAETVSHGPWAVDIGKGSLGEVRLHGTPVVGRATLTGFKPSWTGNRFGLNSAPTVTAGDAATEIRFPMVVDGQVDGEVTLRLTDSAATWRFTGTVQPSGPVEFGLYLPIESYGREDGGFRVFGAQVREFDAREFSSFGLGRGLCFEQPERTLAWTGESAPGAFMLQDKRAGDRALRLITVLPVGDEPHDVSASATLTVTEYPREQVPRRAALLGQRTHWVDPLAVPNGGFEAGAEGWYLPGNAAIEEGEAHSGERAARLTVTDPLTESVYITRRIPVVGGSRFVASCWVKTAGVQRAAGKMASVGAGLIVQWADQDGKWFGAGAYACDLFGDHGWTPRQTADLRAPEEAAYAIIFLAVRGKGTAWFDDLELVQVHQSFALESPEPDATLEDNTPRLAWRSDPGASGYVVELAPTPAFDPAATRRYELEDPVMDIVEPLPPGTWHWRVSAPGYEPSDTWTFDQTAPLTRDTTEPEIAAQPARVTAADQPVIITVRERGSEARPKVTAMLGDQPVRVVADGPTVSLSASWAPGLNWVRISAEDAAGNARTVEMPVLNRPLPDRPVVIGGDGYYHESGERIFPLGIYQVSPAQMPEVAAAGFDAVHMYTFEGSRDDALAAEYLDAAAANGLRVFLGFDRGRSSGQGLVQGNTRHIVDRVAALCSHPGLFCWYLFDEPEIADQYIAPRALNSYADLIRQLDPYHPVVMTTWGKRMALYRRSFDTHWTQAYTTPDGVVARLEEHWGLLGRETPITLLVHSYDRKQTETLKGGGAVDPAAFEPDPQWMRAAAFAGITRGVNGLWWWWYNAEGADWLTVADVPAAWAAHKALVAEIQALEPILVAPGEPVMGEVMVGTAQVVWWRKTVGAETWLIAVNTSTEAIEATLPAPGAAGEATVHQEGRAVPVRNGTMSDRFDRYAVHLYRYPNEGGR